MKLKKDMRQFVVAPTMVGNTIVTVEKTWWQEMSEPTPAMPSDIIMWAGVFFMSILIAGGAMDKPKPIDRSFQEASTTTCYR